MIQLYDHNFDADKKQSVHKDTTATMKAASDLKEQLEAARQQGFDAGRDIGRSDAKSEFDAAAAERFELDRSTIQEQLAQLLARDTVQQSQAEQDLIELFLGIAERLVPELINTYGPDLAVNRIRRAVEQVRTDPILTVRACPDVITALQDESPDWLSAASRSAQIDLVPDSRMSRGAAQVRWKGGRLEYDIEAACTTVLKSLDQAAQKYTEATQEAG